MSDFDARPTQAPPPTDGDDGARRVALLGLVQEEIERIAPDVDATDLAHDVDYRDEVGLDSMDFLALLTAIERRTGVSIPELDYAEIATLDALADYLVARSSPH